MDELKLQELMRLDESELLEFKSNKIEPEKLGKYISALSLIHISDYFCR